MISVLEPALTVSPALMATETTVPLIGLVSVASLRDCCASVRFGLRGVDRCLIRRDLLGRVGVPRSRSAGAARRAGRPAASCARRTSCTGVPGEGALVCHSMGGRPGVAGAYCRHPNRLTTLLRGLGPRPSRPWTRSIDRSRPPARRPRPSAGRSRRRPGHSVYSCWRWCSRSVPEPGRRPPSAGPSRAPPRPASGCSGPS